MGFLLQLTVMRYYILNGRYSKNVTWCNLHSYGWFSQACMVTYKECMHACVFVSVTVYICLHIVFVWLCVYLCVLVCVCVCAHARTCVYVCVVFVCVTSVNGMVSSKTTYIATMKTFNEHIKAVQECIITVALEKEWWLMRELWRMIPANNIPQAPMLLHNHSSHMPYWSLPHRLL